MDRTHSALAEISAFQPGPSVGGQPGKQPGATI